MTRNRIKIDLNDNDGNKITISLEGHLTKEKMLQVLDFMNLVGGSQSDETTVDESNLSKFERIQNLILDEDLRERLGKRSRLLVEESYNWKKISENLGLKITRIYYQKIRKTKNYSY